MKKILIYMIAAILICSCGNSAGKAVKKQQPDAGKPRGYIYYRIDAGKAVIELATELKENRILNYGRYSSDGSAKRAERKMALC